MILNIILLVAMAVLTALLALLGFNMANNPDSIKDHKKAYRLCFLVLSLLLLGATCWQGINGEREKQEAQKEALAEQARLEAQINTLHGETNLLTRYVQNLPPGLDSSQVQATFQAMLGNPAGPWPASSTDAHSAAVLKFLKSYFPEMLDVDERKRIFLYYLIKVGGELNPRPNMWQDLRDLYVHELKLSPDIAHEVAFDDYHKLQDLGFCQGAGAQAPMLVEKYLSRVHSLKAKHVTVP